MAHYLAPKRAEFRSLMDWSTRSERGQYETSRRDGEREESLHKAHGGFRTNVRNSHSDLWQVHVGSIPAICLWFNTTVKLDSKGEPIGSPIFLSLSDGFFYFFTPIYRLFNLTGKEWTLLSSYIKYLRGMCNFCTCFL